MKKINVLHVKCEYIRADLERDDLKESMLWMILFVKVRLLAFVNYSQLNVKQW